MNVFAIIKIALIAAVLVCALIGAFGATYKAKNGGDAHFFLYKTVVAGKTTYFIDLDPSCKDSLHMANSALAFAIIGWIAALAGVAVAALSLFKPILPSIVGVILSAVCAVALTVSWPIAAALYNQEVCGSKVKDSWKYDYGFAFLIISWILSLGWVAFEVLGMLGLIPGGAPATSSTSAV